MSKHTPGPWKICRVTGVESVSGTYIASAMPVAGGPLLVTEAQANARLIAAAPEMLAALESVHRCYFLHSEYPKICEDVDAAIAKAKGESDAR